MFNKYLALAVVFFNIVGCSTTQENTVTIPIEFAGTEFKLGDKLQPAVLEQFEYASSIDAYYLKKNDNSFFFNKIYVWLKRGKIVKLLFERGDITYAEYAQSKSRQESVLNICNALYGKNTLVPGPHDDPSSHSIVGHLSKLKWVVDTTNIEYVYLPQTEFERIKDDIKETESIWYFISYYLD